MINVFQYGAIGDGITDDTLAIQNAISAATRASAGSTGNTGGMVFFPPGTYLHRGLEIYNFIHLRGAGIEATILKLKNGANADSIHTYKFSTLDGTNNIGGVINWSIKDITIDGNKANQSGASNGISAYGYGWIMDSVRVRNCYTHGMYSNWSQAGTAVFDSMEAQMVNCKFHDTGAVGLNLQGPHDTQITNVISYYTGSHNFVIGPNCTGFQAASCHGWGAVTGRNSVAWLVEAPVVSFTNCAAEGSDTMQVVVLSTSKFSWIGGALFSGNVNGGNNTNGMQLGQTAGKSTPYAYSSNQSGGLTTEVYVTSYNINSQFDKLQGPLGSVYFEKDGGFGTVIGPVFFDTSVDWHAYSSVTNAPGTIAGATGYTHSTQIWLSPKIPYATQDGSVAKGGWFQMVIHAFKAFTISDGSQDIFNFNTTFGPVPRCEYPNGCEIRTYSDNYVTRSFAASHGKFAVFESATATTLTTGGTITTSGVGIARVISATNVTGIILQSGVGDAGQMGGGGLFVTVQNEGAFTITFATAGTSNVADGASSVIAIKRAATFEWSAHSSLWYRVS